MYQASVGVPPTQGQPVCICRPQPQEVLPLYEATVAMETVQRHQKKKVVIQL